MIGKDLVYSLKYKNLTKIHDFIALKKLFSNWDMWLSVEGAFQAIWQKFSSRK